MKKPNKTNKVKLMCTIMALAFSCTSVACAQGGGRGGKQGPPQEAIDACEGKSAGDTVTFTGRRGESLNATCETVNDQLIAVPEGHRSRQQQSDD